jgi:hypothetical protein
MNRTRALIAAVAAGSMLAGGAVGALIGASSTILASAATTAPTPAALSQGSNQSGGGNANSGTFTPNEDPTHEAGESAQREAQENAGQRPTVP